MKDQLVSAIKKAKGNVDLYKAPIKAIEDTFAKPCSKGCAKNLRVAILAAPCYGFGDVIFAAKFAEYIKRGLTKGSSGLSNNVTIVTTKPDLFAKLGVKGIPIVSLGGTGKHCKQLHNYTRPSNLKKLDLIFVTPQVDYRAHYPDIKKLLKESTPFNTFFLSEYQPSRDDKSNFDFPTGIGTGFCGLLFDGLKPSAKLRTLGRIPYVFGYAAEDVGPVTCILSFGKMIAAKYHKTAKTLQIVLPEWAAIELADSPTFKRFVKKYYPNVVLKLKDSDEDILQSEKPGKLIIRGDILPVPRKDMLSLIKYSQKDILVTGDQSLTDVIDCCGNKVIWYQTVPWKKRLANALAKELPQKYIKKDSTTCGTLKAVGWNYRRNPRFKRDNDFRRLAKHKLEAIFRAASEAKKKGSVVNRYLQQLEKSKSKKNLLLNFQE